MIIVRLTGGLGNQMFEYAAGRSLSLKHNSELKVDISNYQRDHFRRYDLKIFNIKSSIASPIDILKICPNEGFLQLWNQIGMNRMNKVLWKLYPELIDHQNLYTRYYSYDPKYKDSIPLKVGNIVSQRHFHYDPEFHNCPDNVYLTGTWISENYFTHIKDIIRDDFSFKSLPVGKNLDVMEEITHTHSVSIHIRRTDKLLDPLYEVTNLDYCIKAMDLICKWIEEPKFYIFSDDIAWVKKNLACPRQVTFIDFNDDLHNYEDIRLMSQCKHNIIAESSFSWWGAWLNSNPHKIVISPKPDRWIKRENSFTNDIIPSDWIIVD